MYIFLIYAILLKGRDIFFCISFTINQLGGNNYKFVLLLSDYALFEHDNIRLLDV